VGIRKSAPKSFSTAAPITRLFRSEKNTAEVDYGQAAKRTKAIAMQHAASARPATSSSLERRRWRAAGGSSQSITLTA
jgi:hypothetical protein